MTDVQDARASVVFAQNALQSAETTLEKIIQHEGQSRASFRAKWKGQTVHLRVQAVGRYAFGDKMAQAYEIVVPVTIFSVWDAYEDASFGDANDPIYIVLEIRPTDQFELLMVRRSEIVEFDNE